MTQLGPYTLQDRIGSGAVGVVHRALAPNGDAVAIKIILRSSPERDARLQREVQTQAALGVAAGFVPLLDVGADANHVFLVMPLLRGGCLETRLRSGPLPLSEATALASSLARALGAAHAQGLVHRDLKPANVLFDRSGRAFIADLGLAKEYGQADGPSVTGELRGSVGYMAPEQAENAKHVGPQADVFSWGAILFEALTGRRAFNAPFALDQLRQAEEGLSGSVRDHCPGVDLALARAVDLALEPAPARRPRDGTALLRALQETTSPPRSHTPRRWPLAFAALGAAVVAGALLVPRPTTPATPPPPAGDPPAADAPGGAADEPGGAADSAKLASLLAEWPEDVDLRPHAVYGSERGALGAPLAALAWESEDVLVGVGGTWVVRWDAATGSQLSRVQLGVALGAKTPLAFDAPRGKLWLLRKQRLELWSTRTGTLTAECDAKRMNQLAALPGGDAVALASSSEVAVFREGESRLSWRTRVRARGNTGNRLVAFETGIAVVGDQIRAWDHTGKPLQSTPLAAPLGRDGVVAVRGNSLFLLDGQGTLQEWDTASWRLLEDTPNAAPPTPEKKRVQRFLSPGTESIWLGHAAENAATAEIWRAGDSERNEVRDLRAVAALGRRVALARGTMRTRVTLRDSERALWPSEPAVEGRLRTRPAGGAYSLETGRLVHWSARGTATVLPGTRTVHDGFVATPEGYFAVKATSRLELWNETQTTPLRSWDRRGMGPLGPSALRLVAALPQGRVLGYSLKTLGEREGNTIRVSGQKTVLTVFGPAEEREVDWVNESPPLLAWPANNATLRILCADRALETSLDTGTHTEHARFLAPSGVVCLRPAGAGYLRLTESGLGVWAWKAEHATRLLLPPREAGPSPRRADKDKTRSTLLACTASWAAACLGDTLVLWRIDRESPGVVVPIERPASVCAVGDQLWVGTASGLLIQLALPSGQ